MDKQSAAKQSDLALKVERVVLNALAIAASPPDVCAFGEGNCHRLEDKTIHLGDSTWQSQTTISPQ